MELISTRTIIEVIIGRSLPFFVDILSPRAASVDKDSGVRRSRVSVQSNGVASLYLSRRSHVRKERQNLKTSPLRRSVCRDA